MKHENVKHENAERPAHEATEREAERRSEVEAADTTGLVRQQAELTEAQLGRSGEADE